VACAVPVYSLKMSRKPNHEPGHLGLVGGFEDGGGGGLGRRSRLIDLGERAGIDFFGTANEENTGGKRRKKKNLEKTGEFPGDDACYGVPRILGGEGCARKS